MEVIAHSRKFLCPQNLPVTQIGYNKHNFLMGAPRSVNSNITCDDRMIFSLVKVNQKCNCKNAQSKLDMHFSE